MIKVAFLTVKDTYFENKSVIWTILGHTEGPLVPKVREAICYFSALFSDHRTSACDIHSPTMSQKLLETKSVASPRKTCFC